MTSRLLKKKATASVFPPQRNSSKGGDRIRSGPGLKDKPHNSRPVPNTKRMTFREEAKRLGPLLPAKRQGCPPVSRCLSLQDKPPSKPPKPQTPQSSQALNRARVLAPISRRSSSRSLSQTANKACQPCKAGVASAKSGALKLSRSASRSCLRKSKKSKLVVSSEAPKTDASGDPPDLAQEPTQTAPCQREARSKSSSEELSPRSSFMKRRGRLELRARLTSPWRSRSLLKSREISSDEDEAGEVTKNKAYNSRNKRLRSRRAKRRKNQLLLPRIASSQRMMQAFKPQCDLVSPRKKSMAKRHMKW